MGYAPKPDTRSSDAPLQSTRGGVESERHIGFIVVERWNGAGMGGTALRVKPLSCGRGRAFCPNGLCYNQG